MWGAVCKVVLQATSLETQREDEVYIQWGCILGLH